MKYNDLFYGGSGIDMLVLPGSKTNYKLLASNSVWDTIHQANILTGYYISDNTGKINTTQVSEVERVKFADAMVALDVGVGQNGGSAYRLYKAAFDRTPDAIGLGYWIGNFDNGANVTQVASSFIASPEFSAMYGSTTAYDTFVTLLYRHVLHRDPDSTGMNYWRSELQSGHMSAAAVLASFSESPENVAQVATVIGQGFQYLPWGS